MLLRFSFENFRSFRKKTTLNMIATSQRTMDYTLIKNGKYRILPAAVLYGANASGKSNVILAMSTLCYIIENGSLSFLQNHYLSNLEIMPFLHDNNKEPISFEVEFVTGKDHFIYCLTFNVEPLEANGKRFISEEKLEKVMSRETVMLFHRTKNNITIGKDEKVLRILKYENESVIQNLVDRLVQNMDEKALFLTGGFKSTIRREIADKITDFFTKKVAAIMNLAALSPYIEAIIEPNNGESTDGIMISEALFNRVIKAADFGPQNIAWRAGEQNKHGISKLEMTSLYGNVLIPSDLMESMGTVRLLRFSLILKQFIDEGGILMIDEMDNAIHPEIMKGIIALFGNQEVNTKGAQLVFTSHNPVFMDNKLLRRDQILFTERDPNSYDSSLYSLADFGSIAVRNDQSLMQNYFKGRYGKLPYIDLETVLTHSMEGDYEC